MAEATPTTPLPEKPAVAVLITPPALDSNSPSPPTTAGGAPGVGSKFAGNSTPSDLSTSSSPGVYPPVVSPSFDPTVTPPPSPMPKLPEKITAVVTNSIDIVELENKLWNNQHDLVITALESTRGRNPRYSLMYAEAHFIQCIVTVAVKPIKTTIDLFKQTIALSERYLDSFPSKAIKEGLLTQEMVSTPEKLRREKTNLVAILADAELFCGACMALLDKRIKAGWKFKKAWTLYSDALKKGTVGVPQIDDALISGNAIFLWMLSWLPPIIVKVLEVLGFESDRQKGIQMMRDVYAHGGIRAPYAAALILVNFYVIPRALADAAQLAAEAQPVMNAALAKWPNSLIFQWLASFEARKRGDTDSALMHLNAAIKTSEKTGVPASLELDRCFCQAMCLQWADAIPTLERLSANTQSTVRGMCMVLWASCLAELGQKDKALQVLQSMPPTKDLVGHDRLAGIVATRCKQRVTGPSLVLYEILYLRRDMAHMKPEMVSKLLESQDRAWETAVKSAPKPPGREEATVNVLLRGAALRVLGKTDEAMALLKKAAEESIKKGGEFKEELHVCPFAFCELAEIYHKQGNLDETERCFLISLKHVSGGVYEDFIRPRLRIGLDQVKQEKALIAQKNGVSAPKK